MDRPGEGGRGATRPSKPRRPKGPFAAIGISPVGVSARVLYGDRPWGQSVEAFVEYQYRNTLRLTEGRNTRCCVGGCDAVLYGTAASLPLSKITLRRIPGQRRHGGARSQRGDRPRMPPSPLLGSIGRSRSGQDDDCTGDRRGWSLREPQFRRLGAETRIPPRLGVLNAIPLYAEHRAGTRRERTNAAERAPIGRAESDRSRGKQAEKAGHGPPRNHVAGGLMC